MVLETNETFFGVEEVSSPQPDSRPPESPKVAKKRKELAQQNAAILITLIDGMVSSIFGAEAAMNSIEKMMIEEPLERIMERLDLFSQEAVSKWTDPILLCMGLIAWGSRIARIARDRRESSYQPPDFQQPAPDVKPARSGNGSGFSQDDIFQMMTPPPEIDF